MAGMCALRRIKSTPQCEVARWCSFQQGYCNHKGKEIAAMVQVDVPADVKFLMVISEKVGREDMFSNEKLSPQYYRYRNIKPSMMPSITFNGSQVLWGIGTTVAFILQVMSIFYLWENGCMSVKLWSTSRRSTVTVEIKKMAWSLL